MINEIWLINDGICIYHKVLKDPLNSQFTGLSLEKQLFSGFISALLNFTKTQLDDTSLQKISFNNSIYQIVHVEGILVVLSLNTTYLSENKLKQAVISLTDEIAYIIQTNDKLTHLQKEKKTNEVKILPMNEYNDLFDGYLEKILEDIYKIQNQLVMVDILTLIQILGDLKVLFDKLEVTSQIVVLSLSLSSKAKRVMQNIDVLKQETPYNLFSIEKELKNVVHNSLQSIEYTDLLRQKSSNGHKTVLKFVKKNYTILKQFNFEDLFFKEFMAIF